MTIDELPYKQKSVLTQYQHQYNKGVFGKT